MYISMYVYMYIDIYVHIASLLASELETRFFYLPGFAYVCVLGCWDMHVRKDMLYLYQYLYPYVNHCKSCCGQARFLVAERHPHHLISDSEICTFPQKYATFSKDPFPVNMHIQLKLKYGIPQMHRKLDIQV